MKYQFIHDWKDVFRLRSMCRVLEVSSSGYYAWLNRYASARDVANNDLAGLIKASHKKSRRLYGSPRITADLRAQGLRCSKNRVARVMRANNIAARMKRRFKVTTDSDHKLPVAPNLVKQNFVAERPGQLWTSDITYIWTKEGWLYLAVVLDVCTRKIVGWSANERMDVSIILDALAKALAKRPGSTETIFHSDRGRQYVSGKLATVFKSNNLVSSMGSTGSCYDNAITESFFHTLKTELVYLTKFSSRDEAQMELFDYIEIFYNRQRRHSSIKYLSPAAFENSLKQS
jgi:transposase InsO family protein